MRILFCGTQVPENIEYQIKDISAAGNRFQNNMIANLEKCNHEVITCSYIGVPVPAEIREFLKKDTVFKSDGFLKSLSAYRKRVKKLLDDSDIVICYNITYAWIFLPVLAHAKSKRSIAIIADYSEAVSFSDFFSKAYAYLQGWSMRRFDTVVGLSANIKNKLRKKQRFILMEGGIDRRLYDALSYVPHKKGAAVVLMYAGLLGRVTGVDKLLQVMQHVKNSNVKLMISGKGELEEEIRRMEKENPQICYLGHLTYEEYIERLKEADILVNPRNMKLPENQNNFPSKIMDYLAAGKRIISTKFAGWKRFAEYIDFCDDYGEMAEIIENVSEDFAGEKAVYDRNRAFAGEFLWEEQVERILDKEYKYIH